MLFYYGSAYLISGLLSVVFSLASVFNLVIAARSTGNSPSARIAAGATLGVVGIALMFAPEIAGQDWSGGALLGLGLCVLGTLSFCTGNQVSARLQAARISVVSASAWGMTYGAVLSACHGAGTWDDRWHRQATLSGSAPSSFWRWSRRSWRSGPTSTCWAGSAARGRAMQQWCFPCWPCSSRRWWKTTGSASLSAVWAGLRAGWQRPGAGQRTPQGARCHSNAGLVAEQVVDHAAGLALIVAAGGWAGLQQLAENVAETIVDLGLDWPWLAWHTLLRCPAPWRWHDGIARIRARCVGRNWHRRHREIRRANRPARCRPLAGQGQEPAAAPDGVVLSCSVRGWPHRRRTFRPAHRRSCLSRPGRSTACRPPLSAAWHALRAACDRPSRIVPSSPPPTAPPSVLPSAPPPLPAGRAFEDGSHHHAWR